MLRTAGIHHITAIVNDPQVNFNFYTGLLGLRLVKKTINFDRPEVYHLYFGNELGDPGTVITFFPWPKLAKGRIGSGQVGVTSYVIPKNASSFWKRRLVKYGIAYTEAIRFDEAYIQFQDPDGLQIELVERKNAPENKWDTDIEPENAIRGFAGATLFSAQPGKTAATLEQILGMHFIGQQDEMLRYKSSATIGNIIDIKLSPSVRGLAGAGTIHHIAFRASDDLEHEHFREIFVKNGFHSTEILDRNYFKALYFQEKGGILFEIATDQPGFTVDELENELGTKLMIPPWFEARREEFEAILPPIEVK